jgi:hypothetical protein
MKVVCPRLSRAFPEHWDGIGRGSKTPRERVMDDRGEVDRLRSWRQSRRASGSKIRFRARLANGLQFSITN